jgi:hypothetical protein
VNIERQFFGRFAGGMAIHAVKIVHFERTSFEQENELIQQNYKSVAPSK